MSASRVTAAAELRGYQRAWGGRSAIEGARAPGTRPPEEADMGSRRGSEVIPPGSPWAPTCGPPGRTSGQRQMFDELYSVAGTVLSHKFIY